MKLTHFRAFFVAAAARAMNICSSTKNLWHEISNSFVFNSFVCFKLEALDVWVRLSCYDRFHPLNLKKFHLISFTDTYQMWVCCACGNGFHFIFSFLLTCTVPAKNGETKLSTKESTSILAYFQLFNRNGVGRSFAHFLAHSFGWCMYVCVW